MEHKLTKLQTKLKNQYKMTAVKRENKKIVIRRITHHIHKGNVDKNTSR